MSELLEAALRYMPRTIPIVAGDKRPAVDNWPHWPATRESLAAHYAEHPDDGVGIRTGGGLVALDIDPRHDGHTSLARLERKYGCLPATPEVATGGGGRHLYFRGPAHLRSRDLRHDGIDGVEIKAESGYQLVAPPSVHPDTGKLYVWHPAHPLIEREIASLPAWVAQLAGHEKTVTPTAPALSGLAGRDPLHRIPPSVYVPRLTGRPIGRGGYVQCPIHGADTAPSLKVYADGGWKCYGCGVGGRIYQLAALLGGWPLPLTRDARQSIRSLLIEEFAKELIA